MKQSTGQSEQISEVMIDVLLAEHRDVGLPRYRRFWNFYRNGQKSIGQSVARGGANLAQSDGLPARLITMAEEGASREIVIENDIAWRIHTLVDFMFGRPVAIQSLAGDDERAWQIETLLTAVFDAAGGVAFFQDLALLGAVHGFVDVLLRVPDGSRSGRQRGSFDELLERAGDLFSLDIIEAPRAVPIVNEQDYRELDGYLVHYQQQRNEPRADGFLHRLRDRVAGRTSSPRQIVEHTQAWTTSHVRHYIHDGRGPRGGQGSILNGHESSRTLVDEQPNVLGRIPVVHIQNLAQPFFYEGLSEVEPLIPLQNELNTRLSDRANRVTFQSFKMYLGKGIEHFTQRPVGPGQMWSTDNMDASIETFGGDGHNPSEEAHIREIREAMDKTSSVTPVAAGLLGGKIGNLTSENALRVTMLGLLAKTEKKRITYGAGIARLCELILHAADVTGVLRNDPRDRRVRLDWPSPLPQSEGERLRDAQLKLELGVPRHQVLTELGYAECVGA